MRLAPLCSLINTLVCSKEGLDGVLVMWVASMAYYDALPLRHIPYNVLGLNNVLSGSGIGIEVNILFLLYHLLDALSTLSPAGLKPSDDTPAKPWDPAILGLDSLDTDLKPSAHLFGYKEGKDAQPTRCLSPITLDPDGARSKLIRLAGYSFDGRRVHDPELSYSKEIVSGWMALLRERETSPFGSKAYDESWDENDMARTFLGKYEVVGSPPSAEDMNLYGVPSRYDDDGDGYNHKGENDEEDGGGD